MVEAEIGQFQPQDIFSINAATDRIRGLTVGQSFRKLEERSQRQARRCFCGLTAPREERCELRVLVDSAKTVGHLHVEVPARERGTGDPLGFFRDRIDGLGV
jgi:hypothetical protein